MLSLEHLPASGRVTVTEGRGGEVLTISYWRWASYWRTGVVFSPLIGKVPGPESPITDSIGPDLPVSVRPSCLPSGLLLYYIFSHNRYLILKARNDYEPSFFQNRRKIQPQIFKKKKSFSKELNLLQSPLPSPFFSIHKN